MATENLDAVNLSQVAVDGQIHEDFMDKIYNIAPKDRPFIDGIGTTGNGGNTYKSWVRKDLAAANPENKRIDGSASTGNDTRLGERIGTYHQIMSKTLPVSDRARYSKSVGTGDELILQLMERQDELRRDEEARYTSNLIAAEGNGTSIPGETAGLGGWIGTGQGADNTDRGATGADPILSGSPGGFPATAPVAGTIRAGSESTISDMIEASYNKGGEVTIAMSVPKIIKQFSDYLFTSSARVATLQSHADSSNRTNNGTSGGKSGGGITAQGSVNIFVSNFATVELTPNRFQPLSQVGGADLFLLDMTRWKRSYMQGYTTKELARNGLAENREITVDCALCSLNEEASAVVADLDITLPFTA